MKPDAPFAISLSRQLGSGAAFVGQQLAQRLNVFYADRDIIRRAAEQLCVAEADVERRDEVRQSFWQSFMEGGGFMPDLYVPPSRLPPTERELYEAESDVIDRIVKERSSVIIGRCGFHVLRDHPNHVSIFLHADRAFRMERVQRLYQLTTEAAEQMVAKNDKERAAYCKTFTGTDWANALHFNLCLDTSKLRSLEQVTDCILHYVQAR